MSKKYILAYFNTLEDAERAARMLAKDGVEAIKIDRVADYNDGTLIAEDAEETQVLNSTLDVVKGRDILLTLTVKEHFYNPAVRIIRDHNGVI
ncbi:hypothetical protein [Aneurinibacillus terranovensis]|uniref:hypothetical protein n=1 Tax=Aneurinibacillus terranovensis TaxID=278991 RepID=UPI000400D0C3|nr:hypothetical protein [Aneurinibacillus terranovensis]